MTEVTADYNSSGKLSNNQIDVADYILQYNKREPSGSRSPTGVITNDLNQYDDTLENDDNELLSHHQHRQSRSRSKSRQNNHQHRTRSHSTKPMQHQHSSSSSNILPNDVLQLAQTCIQEINDAEDMARKQKLRELVQTVRSQQALQRGISDQHKNKSNNRVGMSTTYYDLEIYDETQIDYKMERKERLRVMRVPWLRDYSQLKKRALVI